MRFFKTFDVEKMCKQYFKPLLLSAFALYLKLRLISIPPYKSSEMLVFEQIRNTTLQTRFIIAEKKMNVTLTNTRPVGSKNT